MHYNEALQSLKFGREKKFALVGEEIYLKGQFIYEVKEFCKGVSSEFWSDSTEDIFDALSDGLFQNDGAVIIYHAEELDTERLATAIQKSKRIVVVILSEDVNLKTRAISMFLSKMIMVECHCLKGYGGECPAWISAKISSAGYTADDGVVDVIFSKIGTDLFTLENELKKLFILKENTKHIEISDITKSLSCTLMATAYNVLDDLLKRNIPAALTDLSSISSKEGYIDIVAFLFSYIEKMYRMLLLRERKHSSSSIADILGIHKFFIESKYMPRALELGKSFLVKQLDKLCDLDLNIRTFKGDKKVLLERFIYGFSKV